MVLLFLSITYKIAILVATAKYLPHRDIDVTTISNADRLFKRWPEILNKQKIERFVNILLRRLHSLLGCALLIVLLSDI